MLLVKNRSLIVVVVVRLLVDVSKSQKVHMCCSGNFWQAASAEARTLWRLPSLTSPGFAEAVAKHVISNSK